MIGKHVFGLLASVILIVSCAMVTVAQTGDLRGHVWMQQADGQKVPLADALIEIFREDQKGRWETKSNKKGEFVHAGLPYTGTYYVAASHPTASPNFVPGFKVGREISCEIVVTPGDGKKLTLEELKTAAPRGPAAAAGNSGGAKESEADKAKREELLKKNKEIEEANKKAASVNEIMNRTFTAGNQAMTAGNAAGKSGNSELAIQKYSEAVTQFEEGLAAAPDEPAILTSKALALKSRGVERYNAAVKSTGDDASKNALREAAGGDFRSAAEAATKSATLMKAQEVPVDPAKQKQFTGNKYAAFITRADAMRLFYTKVDQSPAQADAALEAYRDYISVETDPAKKTKAQLDASEMLLSGGASDKALTQYKEILATQPDSPEANLGAGLALYGTNDKAKFQEAANYIQHFVDVAPDTHPMKQEAKAILTQLKENDKVVPEKTPPRRPRRP